MVKTILQEGDKTLRQISKDVKPEDIKSPKFESLKEDLLDSLHSYEYGIAIAAVQIGIPLRVFVMDSKDSKSPEIFINPKVTWTSEKSVKKYESCLSVAYSTKLGEVVRPFAIKLEYLNESGTLVNKKFDGLKARTILHEIDHLNGILFTDIVDKSSIMDIDDYLLYVKQTRKSKEA